MADDVIKHLPIALPNLHRFVFCGVGNYLEAIVHWITTLGKVSCCARKRDVLAFWISTVVFFLDRLALKGQSSNGAEFRTACSGQGKEGIGPVGEITDDQADAAI